MGKQDTRAKRRESLRKADAERLKRVRDAGIAEGMRKARADLDPMDRPDEIGRVYLQAAPPSLWRVYPPRPEPSVRFDPSERVPVLRVAVVRSVEMAQKLSNGATVRWWAWEEVGP